MSRPGQSIPIAVRLFPCLFACLSALPRDARAHSVGDVVTVGNSRVPNAPSSPYLSEKLSGSWDPREWLTLRLDATWTHNFPVPAPPMAAFGTSAANIFYLNLGIDFLPNDHWTFSLDVNGSPRSELIQDNPITFASTNPRTGMMVSNQYDSQATESASSIGGIVSAAYDTAGEAKAETSVDASVSFNWFDTQLKVDQIVDAMGKALTTTEIQQGQMYCQAHRMDSMKCAPRFVQLLNNAAAALKQPASEALGQFTFLAGVTETLYRNTDVGVSGSYYLYTSDPTAALTSSTTIGKSGSGGTNGGGAHVVNRDFGTGIALAPFWWTVRPEITERIGGFSIGASFQYGQYVDNASYTYNLTLGTKLMFKHRFDKFRFKTWLSGTGQRDVDSSGVATLSGLLALGAKFSF